MFTYSHGVPYEDFSENLMSDVIKPNSSHIRYGESFLVKHDPLKSEQIV